MVLIIGEKKPYKCTECTASFHKATRLKNHVQKIHRNEKSYACTQCDAKFFTREFLKYHEVTHDKNAPKPFNCEQCSTSFHFTRQLKSHMRKRHPEPSSKTTADKSICEFCSFEFRHSRDLYYHQVNKHFDQMNLTEHPFKCDKCDKVFSKPQYLKCHQNLHDDMYPYECEICGKKFSWKHSLTGHMNVHNQTKTQPYKCKVCSKTYAHSGTLSWHMAKHRNEEFMNTSSGMGSIECKICKRKFQKQGSLQVHMKIHEPKPVKTCPQCGATFLAQKPLTIHLKSVHKIFPNGKSLKDKPTTTTTTTDRPIPTAGTELNHQKFPAFILNESSTSKNYLCL